MALTRRNDHPMCLPSVSPPAPVAAQAGRAGEGCVRMLLDHLGGAAPPQQGFVPGPIPCAAVPALAELRAP